MSFCFYDHAIQTDLFSAVIFVGSTLLLCHLLYYGLYTLHICIIANLYIMNI